MKSNLIAVDARMWNASGIGTHIRNLVPAVALQDLSATYHLMGLNDGLPHEWADLPNITRGVGSSPIYTVREQIEIPLRLPPATDLVWFPHYNFSLLLRGRAVVTIQDLLHLARPEFTGGLHRRMYARTMFQAARRAAGLIFTSQFTADEFTREIGLPRSSSAIIPLAVDDSWFEAAKLPKEDSAPYLVYVGNVKPHKNVSGLLDGFSSVMHRIQHKLIIIGKREGFITSDPAVARRAARLGDRVAFTGWIDNSELQRYVANADALLLPSFYEGFGLPPLEAMASGCPTIVSNAGALPEVCGEASLYCDPRDPVTIGQAILTLVNNPQLREALIRAGQEQVSKLSWSHTAAETVAFFDAVP